MINLTTTYGPIFLSDRRRMKNIFALLVLLLCMTQYVVADPLFIPLPDDERGNYSYIWFVNNKDSIKLTDEQFYDNSAKVVFPINKYGLPKGDKTLEELEKVILPQINEDSMKLVAIVIRGAASPEGPYQFNKMLSERRAKALTDYVTSRLIFKDLKDPANKRLSEEFIVEDYRSLCIALERANDPDYEFVKDLCDNYLAKNDERHLKSALMKTRKGQLWKRLRRTYFPDLRAARIMLFFRKQESSEMVVALKEITPDESKKTGALDIKPSSGETTVVATDTLLAQEVEEEGVFLRKKMLAVKTNVLLYGAYIPGYDRWAPIPNIAIEYYPLNGHFTFGASFDMPWWQDYDAHKYFQFRNYQLEARYYPRGAVKASKSNNRVYEPNLEAYEHNKKAFTGFYLQAYTHLAVFGICFDADRGWVGEGIGAGVGAGYVLPLSSSGRWKLELGLQVGFFRCKYDPYQFENPVNPAYRDGLYYYKWTQSPDLFKKRQYRWNWIGPTRVGITLSYDLLYRRIQKKGISFKSYETYKTFRTQITKVERREQP